MRIIVDARRCNARFRTPPGVDLCSAEGLTRVEVEAECDDPSLEDLALHLGVADVQDAFHRFRLRDEFASWFCVGVASIDELVCRTLPRESFDKSVGAEVDLCWASLPMGFTWSLFFCQVTNEALMRQVPGLSLAPKLADKEPPIVFDSGNSKAKAFFVYVDNLGIISCDAATVEDNLSQATRLF